MIYISDGTPIIGINSLHHPNRQRFSIGHEIRHLALHRNLTSGKVHVDKEFLVQLPTLNRDAASALGTDLIEIEANRFSAELLMPTSWFLQALSTKPFEPLAWSPAFFIGHNSLEFDEHLLRQAFYKSLHPPYLTNANGNSRSDALRMVQAASLFARDALVFPTREDGEFVFKLDRVAHGFAHERAHDAIADVEATIFLSRRLMERAPELWSAFMRFSQKAAVCDHIVAEPIFCSRISISAAPIHW